MTKSTIITLGVCLTGPEVASWTPRHLSVCDNSVWRR